MIKDGNFTKISAKFAIALIILITLLAYANSLNNSFVLDDTHTILNNNFIKSWKNFPAIFTRSYLTPFKNNIIDHSLGAQETSYRPVVTVSYFIDYAIWGLEPFGYHLTNLFLHIFNAILFYYFITFVTKNIRIGLFSALLFALHPINTEAVNAVSFREDLLSFLFFIFSLILYIKLDKYSGRRKALIYVLSLLSFLIALFSKEMAVTLPFIIILYDWFFASNDGTKDFFMRLKSRYLGFFSILLFYIWIRFFVMNNLTAPPVKYPGGDFYINILTMFKVFAIYIKGFFWPFDIHYVLSGDPSLISYPLLDSKAIVSIGLIIFCFAVAIKTYRNSRKISFSIFWFFITLLPVANIWPLTNYMAVRYLYTPAAGLCFLVPAAILNLNSAKFNLQKIGRNILIAIFVLYSFVTIKINNVWKDNISLWSEMVKKYPDSPMSHLSLGFALLKKGSIDSAVTSTKNALKIKPDYAEAHRTLGKCYLLRGEFKEATRELNESLKLEPASADAHNDLGAIFAIIGNMDEAKKKWTKASEINPRDSVVKGNLKEIERLGY